MTTKILTVRVSSAQYSALSSDAGELGVSISAHIRRLVEREHQSGQLTELRGELLARLDGLAASHPQPAAPLTTTGDEVLLLCRAVAAHLNPQLVAQVRAKLTQPA